MVSWPDLARWKGDPVCELGMGTSLSPADHAQRVMIISR